MYNNKGYFPIIDLFLFHFNKFNKNISNEAEWIK